MSTRARVRADEPDAFRELFDEHARPVYNHSVRLTGDWSASGPAHSVPGRSSPIT